jgi:hypothetical protein
MVDTEHMSVLLTIGEFSRMTHLSVKALHHYDDVGLLSHAKVDNAALSVMSIRPTVRSERLSPNACSRPTDPFGSTTS